MESGKIRQVKPLVEDERGFDAAISEKQLTAKLRQGTSVLSHVPIPLVIYLSLNYTVVTNARKTLLTTPLPIFP
jgi:hypothetical protein